MPILTQSTHCHNGMRRKLIANFTHNGGGAWHYGKWCKKAKSVKIAFGAKMSNASEWHMVKKLTMPEQQLVGWNVDFG